MKMMLVVLATLGLAVGPVLVQACFRSEFTFLFMCMQYISSYQRLTAAITQFATWTLSVETYMF